MMALAVLTLLLPGPAATQSIETGKSIFQEAVKLSQAAKTKEQLRKGEQMFQEALEIFEKTGHEAGQGEALTRLGNISMRRADYSTAEDLFQKALEIQKKLGSEKGEAVLVLKLGDVAYRRGNLSRAAQQYERSLKLAEKSRNTKVESAALTNLGNVYSRRGLYGKAIESFQQSLKSEVKRRDLKGQATDFNNIGSAYLKMGRYPHAMEYFKKALEIARKKEDSTLECLVLNNLGVLHASQGEYAKAVEYYETTLESYRKNGDVRGQRSALHNLGNVYIDWGMYPKALALYKQALDIATGIGDTVSRGHGLIAVGAVHWELGRYSLAAKQYEMALGMARETGDIQGITAALNNLGGLYAIWGRYLNAVDSYTEALEVNKKSGMLGGQARVLHNLGSVYKSLGQYDKSVAYITESLDIRKKIGDVRGTGSSLILLANVYVALGQYEKALETLKETIAMWGKIGVPTGSPKDFMANIYLDLGDTDKAGALIEGRGFLSTKGRLYLKKQAYEQARGSYDRLRKSAEKNRNASGMFVAYTGLGAVHEALGEDEQAAGWYRKAIDHLEEIRQSLGPAERASFYHVYVGGFLRTEPYEGLARVLIRLNQYPEALRTSEYTKARVFAEAMAARASESPARVPPQIVETDQLINNELAALTKSLQSAHEKVKKRAIAALEPQVIEAREKLSKHVERLRKDYPLFTATKYPQPLGLERSAVADGQYVLAYDVTDNGVIVFLAHGKNRLKGWFKPVVRQQIDRLVRRLRAPLEVSPDDSAHEKLASFDVAAAKELAQILLGDVLPELPPGVPVIVIPDDVLGVLPFEMLIIGGEGKIVTERDIPCLRGVNFFGDRNPISYYQSLTALTLARTLGQREPTSKGLLVVADPVFEMQDTRVQTSGRTKVARPESAEKRLYRDLMAPVEEGGEGLDFPRLPLTGDLARQLAALFKGDSSVITGMDATKQSLLKKMAPDLERFGKLVFATHGYFGTDLPGIAEPVLILSLIPPGTDGYVRMSEVMGLKLNADVVALTACQTGLGRQVRGEGTMGMGRAFQYAGARSVLMSFWSVAETSSVDLVAVFFRHLKEGKTRLEALTLARKQIRDAGYDHPFFWSAFILVGETSP